MRTRESLAVGAPAPLFLVSASILLLEIYWLRAFAEAEWGHVASMVVSTAMLGIGFGGTLILVLAETTTIRPIQAWRTLLFLFPIVAGIAPLIVGIVPFEPLLLFWRSPTWAWLVLRELVVASSFATGAAAVALAFRTQTASPGKLYATNLLGSTAGVLVALGLMATRPCNDLLRAAVAAAALAAVFAVYAAPLPRIFLAVLGAIWASATGSWSSPHLAEAKDLALALRLPKATILADLPGVPGRWTLVASPAFHVAPGLSLLENDPLPPQRSLFLRGDERGTLYGRDGTQVLRHRTAWLPYEIRPPDSVLVLGNGAVLEIQAAQLAAARRIVGVVADSRTRNALRSDLGRFAGLAGDQIDLRADGERATLARLAGRERYDLVVLPPDDSLDSAAAGLASGLESYSLTVEGLAAALDATTDRGQITVQRWTQAPPRDLPKLVATLVRVFASFGIRDIRAHLALVQHWDAWTLCASRRAYDENERSRLAEFARAQGFDLLLPEMPSRKLLHELPGPPIASLLDEIFRRGDGSGPENYPFTILPTTDDQPYFHHFLSYRHLGSYLAGLRAGTIPPADWGDWFLWASLASAACLGAAVIAAPAFVSAAPRVVLRGSVVPFALFASLGLGYMFFEVLLIHHGTKLLGEPSLTAAVVLLAFLLGSGIGALTLAVLGEGGPAGPTAALVAAVVAVSAAVWLEFVLNVGLRAPVSLRWFFLFLPAVFIAIPLGMPFPAGLARYTTMRPEQIPWLVAVNGWSSVVGAISATILAMTVGFRALGAVIAALYLFSSWLLARKPT